MEIKLFEVVDRATRYSIMVVAYGYKTPKERWLLERVGLGNGSAYSIQVTELETGKTERDRFKWRSEGRTLFEAYKYIADNWNTLSSGDLIDVEYILGEVDKPKKTGFVPLSGVDYFG